MGFIECESDLLADSETIRKGGTKVALKHTGHLSLYHVRVTWSIGEYLLGFLAVSYLAVLHCKHLVWNERSMDFDGSCPSTNQQKARRQNHLRLFLLSFLGKWRERLKFKFSETQREVRV